MTEHNVKATARPLSKGATIPLSLYLNVPNNASRQMMEYLHACTKPTIGPAEGWTRYRVDFRIPDPCGGQLVEGVATIS